MGNDARKVVFKPHPVNVAITFHRSLAVPAHCFDHFRCYSLRR
jgi:hypothetical protein